MSTCNLSHLIFGKDVKRISWRNESIFNKWCWENWMSTTEKSYICHLVLTPSGVGLNLKLETLKLLEENPGNTIHHIGVGKDFLYRIAFAKELPPTIDKWNFLKLNSFCTPKEAIRYTCKEEVHRVGEKRCQL